MHFKCFKLKHRSILNQYAGTVSEIFYRENSLEPAARYGSIRQIVTAANWKTGQLRFSRFDGF